MKRPQILLDFDSVLAELLPVWIGMVNQDYGCQLRPADIDRWHWHELTPPECGLKAYDYLWRPDLYDTVVPVPGALWAVKILAQLGDLTVVTSSNALQATFKLHWLNRWGFTAYLRQTIAMVAGGDGTRSPDKGLVQGDILVDDYVGNLAAFKGQGILLRSEAPYTHGDVEWPAANNWPQCVELITGLIASRDVAPSVLGLNP